MASGNARPGRAERQRRHAEREKQRAEAARFQKRVTWTSLGLILAGLVLGLGAGALGAAEVYPYEQAMTVSLAVMAVFVGLGLLVAACAGMYVMGGWRAAPFGAVLVAGIAVLAWGVAQGDRAWRDVGVVLLAISCASFWAVPALLSPRAAAKPRRPATTAKSAGLGGVLLAGALIAAVGYATDLWWVLLFGALAVGTAAGAGIAMRAEDRRTSP
ncbi:hypothetical protein [Glycomyces harbinensis]|uniref:Uncharacterized protein n=1 Tax=Glycomyces harbinensis TaxID=58114 RepID=A0A1G6R410_9ACTN|nr:hypothetical protein [Glycomyces harbinensis]SDC98737.1 hypothetical protein SAMN05216270_101253 [Glycomyces harbinensis]